MNIWTILIPALSTIFGSGLTYWFTRRKNNADAQKTELENVQNSLKIYREMLNDLGERINLQAIIIEKQEKEIQRLTDEVNSLRNQTNANTRNRKR